LELPGTTPVQYSSSHPHYLEVVMSLFACQNGLCAYTEQRLCAPEHFSENLWENGYYDPDGRRPDFEGHVEHFDPTLKQNFGWRWDNLFMVDSDVNTKIKKTRPVEHFLELKPDHPAFHPDHWLEYSPLIHWFVPHRDLTSDDRNRVQEMIDTLGLNYSPVVAKRRELIEAFLCLNRQPQHFPTAYRMCLELLAD
jgi:hypothetical protein